MQTINLNQNSFRLFPTIYMVQNDTGRELKMILDDVTLAGTETGAVAIKRSDGSYYTIPATLASGENAFTADMTQALTQPSMTECQLKITDENDLVVSSYTFHIKVQPSTDGISEEQLGYSVQEVIQAAQDIMTGGMPLDLRMALLQIAQKVAYVDDQGTQYYQDLYDALMPSAELVSISAVYTQSGTVYDTDTLDSLKADLVVTATYSDSSTETLPASAYTLSGTLTEGTSTIIVTYEGKTDTFDVTVASASVSANWTIGRGIYFATGSSALTVSNSSNNTRALFAHTDDQITYTELPKGTGVPADAHYWAIEIPNGVSGVSVTVPTDVYCGIGTCYYNGATWVGIDNDYYYGPNTTKEFTFAQNATHFVLYLKHGSAGTAAVTQTDIDGTTVTFLR